MSVTKIKEAPAKTTALRKEEVMNVAARLFAAKGYYETTLDQIAEESALPNRPSIITLLIRKISCAPL
jgi:AcrR family transcriptional regulator